MKTLLLCLFTSLFYYSSGQDWLQQYFDGNDTVPSFTLNIELDTNETDIWQIGEPEKTLFDTAFSQPNVLITDTINFLPDSTTSSFYFTIDGSYFAGSILAIQWTQKIDMDTATEVGIIEYSKDSGNTWVNVFDEPLVDNFYGFQSGHQGFHHIDGDEGLTGTDTVWRDIWLCFNYDFLMWEDTVTFRYTVKTDTVEHQSEGWMIDNFWVHATWFHTIGEISDEDEFIAFPTETSGKLTVRCHKANDPPKVQSVELIDLSGRIAGTFKPENPDFELDLSRFPDGQYKLKIITNQGFDICPVIVHH